LKQITRQEKDMIESMGWDKDYRSSGCKGISVVSKTHPRAKTYWAIDTLAFKVWKATGRNIDDKDYQEWLKKQK